MAKTLKLKIGDVEATVKLLDNETADKLWEVAPFESSAETWGDEVYFSTPAEVELEGEFAREVVEVGDVGYWPPGRAMCLFFGPTPISHPGEIRPASPVALVGRLSTDPEDLRKVREGDPIRVERG
ncbi:MAG TPA: hypothetical protein EYP17_06660 [Candidatus Latescibacteria bacterium]|nr:hypothetical protein [Candidatus Latescibacterota bacterium]